jgi:hypothetical protein
VNTIKPLIAHFPRTLIWALCTVFLCMVLANIAPDQVVVVIYKIALVFLGGLIGYWLDRAAFPYARPDGYLVDFWQRGTDEPIGAADFEVCNGYYNVYALAMLRRALIMIAVIIAMAIGL